VVSGGIHTVRAMCKQLLLSMSQSASSSPYPRDDWWGDDDTDDERQGHAVSVEGPPAGYEQDLARWKAHRILKDTATKLCGLSLREHDTAVELTEPCIRPPDDPVADQRHSLRYNPERGYISGPHQTWVQLDDRPRQKFMALVETCLDLWQDNHGVSERGTDALRSKAGELKGRQSYRDEQILTELILAVIAPVPVIDYEW
jgi:hypothetical protein